MYLYVDCYKFIILELAGIYYTLMDKIITAIIKGEGS